MIGLLAAVHESGSGPKLPTRNVRYSVAIAGKADATRTPLNVRS